MTCDFRGSKPAFMPRVGRRSGKLCRARGRRATGKENIVTREERREERNRDEHEMVMSRRKGRRRKVRKLCSKPGPGRTRNLCLV